MVLVRWPTPDEARELSAIAATMMQAARTLLQNLGQTVADLPQPTFKIDVHEEVMEATKIIAPYFAQTMSSVVALLLHDDYASAGAVARKAAEIMYAILILAKRGQAGVHLISIAGTKSTAGLHKKTLSMLDEAKKVGFAGIDELRADLQALLKKIKKVVPNGDISRVEPKTLSEWAGMSTFHETTYSHLNTNSHFDVLEANELASRVTGGPMMHATNARRYFDVVRASSKITAHALGGLNVLGDRNAHARLNLVAAAIKQCDIATEKIYLRNGELMRRFGAP